MLLKFSQPVLMGVGMVSDSIGQLHVPEELEDLHGPENNVLDCLLADATQRCRVDISGCLGLWLLLLLRWRRLPPKG